MFTIKHIVGNSFDEMIWEAPSVRYAISPGTGKPTISFEVEGGATASIDNGLVYVMNREGATVAKYDMRVQDPAMQPATLPRGAAYSIDRG